MLHIIKSLVTLNYILGGLSDGYRSLSISKYSKIDL